LTDLLLVEKVPSGRRFGDGFWSRDWMFWLACGRGLTPSNVGGAGSPKRWCEGFLISSWCTLGSPVEYGQSKNG